jgi:TonB family protein
MKRFYACLTLSILLHIAVLIPFELMANHGLYKIPQVIKVALVDSPADIKPPKTEKITQPDFDISYQKNNEVEKKPDNSEYPDEKTDRVNGVPVELSNKADFSYYGKVKGKILVNYSYPQKAIDEGVHGYVQVTFIIDSYGNVSSLKVTKSSGYKILDHVSSKAVLDASPFEPREDSIKLEVGFLYVLDN